MKTITLFFSKLAALLLILSLPQQAAAGSEFIALAFHDIVDTRLELTYDGVTTDHLIDQLEWLRINNYHPVSIDDLLAARDNQRPLPENPILLCWDDAYVSFYSRVLPLLKAYNYPAVLAVVGSWVTPNADGMVQYGTRLVSRDNFMSWQQLQEAANSGLVEIASHSNNLHKALLADPFGDKLPAAITHEYNPADNSHETDEQFSSRVQADLQASSDMLAAHLGVRPRVLVWPFGRYNEAARLAAVAAGMPMTLTLNPVAGNTDHLAAVGRIYPTENPNLLPFRTDLGTQRPVDVNHFIRIKSQELLEPSVTEEKIFSVYLNRVKDLSPAMVILDPIVEVDGVRKALFRNQRFPLVQDRLNRLCWHTDKRAGATVALWLDESLFTPQQGETAVAINRFFADMGKSAPTRSLIVDIPTLLPAMITAAEAVYNGESHVHFWNPDQRHQARKALPAAVELPARLSQLFQALESFQFWQPFQEINLVLSLAQLQDMETNQVAALLNLFDTLIIQTGDNKLRQASAALKDTIKLLDDAGLLQKCLFLLSMDDHSNIARALHQLPTLNIINWGYQFDNFQQGIPAADAVRPYLSKEGFPYPLRH